MYRIGERPPHHRRTIYLVLVFAIAFGIVGGSLAAKHYFTADTSLSQSKSVVRHVQVARAKTKQVQNKVFSMKIPATWESFTSDFAPPAPYAWRGNDLEDSARRIDIYIDDIPAKMAVNRLLPLRASGNNIVVGDNVSDNCVNFTEAQQADTHTGIITAKWSGVTFYCDSANSSRNLVGVGTPDTINGIVLKGPQTGKHRVFFVYTDHSSSPDYTAFTNMLDTFALR